MKNGYLLNANALLINSDIKKLTDSFMLKLSLQYMLQNLNEFH